MALSIPLSTTGMQSGVIGLGVLAAVAVVCRWGVVRATPLDGVLLAFYGTLALSTGASGHPLEAVGWDRLWIVLGYFTLFWWLPDGAAAARFARLVVVAALIAAVYGILQYYTGADWYRTLLGRPTAVRPRHPGDTHYAVVGFFRNYLTYAHTMLFPLAWAGALALRGQAGAATGRIPPTGADRLGMVAAPLILVAIAFSTARGAWLAAVAVGLGLLAVAGGRRAAHRVGLGLAVAAVLAFVLAPELRVRGSHMFARGGDNAGRVAIYQTNLEIVHDHPVLGLGFGRYARAAEPYYAANPAADRRSHAHSNYLHLAAEAGLAGLAAFCLLLATALVRGWPGTGASWAATGAWVGIVGFLVGGMTQYTFGDNEVALAMWAALAVLLRCRAG